MMEGEDDTGSPGFEQQQAQCKRGGSSLFRPISGIAAVEERNHYYIMLQISFRNHYLFFRRSLFLIFKCIKPHQF